MTPAARAELLRLVDMAEARHATMVRRTAELQEWIEGSAAAIHDLPAEEGRRGRYAVAYHATLGAIRKRRGAAASYREQVCQQRRT